MKRIMWMIILTLLCLGLSGCAKQGDDLSSQMSETESTKESQNQQEESSTTEESTETEIEEVDFTTLIEDMFSNRDSKSDYNSKDAIVIQLKQDKIEASDKSVRIEGTTIYLTEEETYIISGSLEDGRIVVQAEENAKLQLIFNGVDIHSENSAALALIEGDKVFITLAEGSRNRISGGATIEEVEESKWDGAIYSKIDLTFNGSLTISGGFIYVANPVAGDTSVLDSDKDPVITGGTFISTGSTTMMAQTFSEESTQGVIACTVGNQSAGTRVVVKDSEGKEVIAYDVEYACVLVIISSPDLIKGAEYTMTIGNASGTISAY